RLAPEASGLAGFLLRGILLSRSVFASLQGLSYAALSGSRGSVAGCQRASSGSVEPYEAPLARLEDGAREPLSRDVEIAQRNAVEFHAPLPDQPASLARREAEGVGEHGRQMDGIAGRKRLLRHLLGSLATAHDAGEVLLRGAGRLLPVRPRHD